MSSALVIGGIHPPNHFTTKPTDKEKSMSHAPFTCFPSFAFRWPKRGRSLTKQLSGLPNSGQVSYFYHAGAKQRAPRILTDTGGPPPPVPTFIRLSRRLKADWSPSSLRGAGGGGAPGPRGAGVEWGVEAGLCGEFWCMSASSSATVFILRCRPADTDASLGHEFSHYTTGPSALCPRPGLSLAQLKLGAGWCIHTRDLDQT